MRIGECAVLRDALTSTIRMYRVYPYMCVYLLQAARVVDITLIS